MLASVRQPRTNKSLARDAKNFMTNLQVWMMPLRASPKIGLHLYRRRMKLEFALPAKIFYFKRASHSCRRHNNAALRILDIIEPTAKASKGRGGHARAEGAGSHPALL